MSAPFVTKRTAPISTVTVFPSISLASAAFNVGNALFSGVMVLCMFFFVVFLVSAFVLGKWLLPKIAEQIKEAGITDYDEAVVDSAGVASRL